MNYCNEVTIRDGSGFLANRSCRPHLDLLTSRSFTVLPIGPWCMQRNNPVVQLDSIGTFSVLPPLSSMDDD
jgi:hypothetical protein